MATLSIERKVLAGVALVVATLAIAGVISYNDSDSLRESTRRVSNSYENLERLEAVLVDMKGFEDALRGFLVTGDQTYLASYRVSIDGFRLGMSDLRSRAADNHGARRRLESLEPAIIRKIADADQLINRRTGKSPDAEAQPGAGGAAKVSMDSIRTIIAAIAQEERESLRERLDEGEPVLRRTIAVFSALLILDLLILTLIYFAIRAGLARRQTPP
jgi:CHASE3 domain sensor protein